MMQDIQRLDDRSDRCAYCGAALDRRYYFCLACATPYQDEATLLPPVRPVAPTEGELIAQHAPAALPLFWTYFCVVLGSALVSYALIGNRRLDLALILQSVLMFLVTAVLAGMYWPSLVVQFRRLGLFQRAGVLSLLALAPMLGLNYAYSAVMTHLIPQRESLLEKLRESSLGHGGLVLLICILPALVEEVAFRGLLQHWLQVAIRPMRAVMVASALFTALHFSVISAPYIFLLGLLLGWAKWKTGSLYPSILIHFLHNLAVIEFFPA